MSKILLVDADGKTPNLALMRLSQYHKLRLDRVELLKLDFGGYPGEKKPITIDAKKYDKVYVSTLYTWNKDLVRATEPFKVEYGGTGYDIKKKLPDDVDKSGMDCSLYGSDTAYGFLTRGCIRKCGFCVVPEKEGDIHKVSDILDIYDPKIHKSLVLMDNNILGHPDHEVLLQQLIDLKIKVHFNSGLDIRLVNESNLLLLSKLKYFGEYLFSFDIPKQRKWITEKAELVKRFLSKPWKLKMCILVGWNTDLVDDFGRIFWCLDRQILPYVMRHEKCWSSDHRDLYIDMAAWANQPAFVKKLTFEQFLGRRHKNMLRRANSTVQFKYIEADAKAFC